MNRYISGIAVFVCGAVTMIMEIAGSRALAPFLGTSIVIWTALIGVILGALSFGYWLGGRIADRCPSVRVFSAVIFAAGIFIVLSVLIRGFVLNLAQDKIQNIHAAALMVIFSLFAAPSILLGMVTPYAVRLRIKSVESSGAAAGNIYALSTAGSIAGTFAAGFFLIPLFGSTNIFFMLAAALFAVAVMAHGGHLLKIKTAALIFALAVFFPLAARPELLMSPGVIDLNTAYNRLLIITDMNAARPTRSLIMDPYGIQSAMYLDASDELVFEYTKFFRLAGHFRPDIKNALMFGGAAYSYPKDFLRRHENATMDVVEIDPGMTAAAREYFYLPDDPRLNIFHEDARTFLNRSAGHYDVIFGDAFNSRLSIPFQLTTKEAVEKIYGLLNEGGVAMINLVSAIEGEKGKFLRAELATYRAVFPRVFVFTVRPADPADAQNIILVALKSEEEPELTSDNHEYAKYLARLWTGEIAADMPVLTDDYAPVDYYNMQLF